MSYYSDRSRAVIAEAIAAGKRQGLAGRALADFVAERYPFDLKEKAAWPIWRVIFDAAMKKELPPAASQPSMFGDEPKTRGIYE